MKNNSTSTYIIFLKLVHKVCTSLVKEKVLGLDVSMTDTIGVNVGQGAEQLVHVQLDEKDWNTKKQLEDYPEVFIRKV